MSSVAQTQVDKMVHGKELATAEAHTRVVVPLRERKADVAILSFFLINLLFVTYIIDVEQLIIANPYDFDPPAWPLPFMVDLIHWWGHNFDPVLMARPMWWRMTIWIDSLFFGPFYLVAIYAYLRGREWIRIPSIIYASVMLTNVTIILGEEMGGTHATPRPGWVLLANASWVLFPLFILFRMWMREHPFTRVRRRV